MTRRHWEHFPHEADMGVRGIGASKAEAFEQAAVALTHVMLDSTQVNPREGISVACEAPDDELLFADWLNALIYEMATRRMLFSHFQVEFEGNRLMGKAWGEKIDRLRHQPAIEVKGATYTALKVRQQKDGTWLAQCVVDV